MDILSIAGFALNVASYLKENPIDFGQKKEEPVAVTSVSKVSKPLTDIQMPSLQKSAMKNKKGNRYPQGIRAHQKKSMIRQEGEASLVRPTSTHDLSGLQSSKEAPVSHAPAAMQSGLDRSGRYFFRKRGS